MIIPDCSCGRRCMAGMDKCATCLQLERRADRVKMPSDPDPIKKVSQSQAKLLSQYAVIKKRFMLNRWCAYHGKPCLPTDIHHAKGRVGFADEQEIPLLLDVRYFVPVCRVGHDYIEANPQFAKDNGFSESRLTKAV
jgi:hypothetical protein